MSDLQKIVDNLSSLSVLDLSKLCDELEGVWGVSSASAIPAMQQVMPDSNSASQVEEQTEFDVVITSIGAVNKISLIKEVRSVTSLGLKEAKALVDGIANEPQVLKSAVSKEEAQSIKSKFESLDGSPVLELK